MTQDEVLEKIWRLYADSCDNCCRGMRRYGAKGYAAPVYEVEQPENIQSTEADAKEKKQETEETEQAKKGNFDLADDFYKGSGTGFAGISFCFCRN